MIDCTVTDRRGQSVDIVTLCLLIFPDTLKNRVSVGTLKFVLFLYIQQLHKVSLKASLVAGDEYPL